MLVFIKLHVTTLHVSALFLNNTMCRNFHSSLFFSGLHTEDSMQTTHCKNNVCKHTWLGWINDYTNRLSRY